MFERFFATMGKRASTRRHVEMLVAGARRNELRHLPRQSEARFGFLHPVRRFDAAERLR
jgi:hypothetical protein